MKTKHLLIGAGLLVVAVIAYNKFLKPKPEVATAPKPAETPTTAPSAQGTVMAEEAPGGLASFSGGGTRGAKSGQPVKLQTFQGHVSQGM